LLFENLGECGKAYNYTGLLGMPRTGICNRLRTNVPRGNKNGIAKPPIRKGFKKLAETQSG